jgi:multidrug efflux pump subunit AcrA (membrane-fusion protein)
MSFPRCLPVVILAGLALVACGGEEAAAPKPMAEEAAPISNRIDIPAAVRQSLGMTFAKAELRPVERTLRIAGRFELEPDARREYRALVAGRVEPALGELARVQRGDLLFTIESPAWRELQGRLAEAEAAVARAQAVVDGNGPLHEAHEAHARNLEAALGRWEERIRQLEAVRAAGGGVGEALSDATIAAATVRSQLAEIREKDVTMESDRRISEATLAEAIAGRDLLVDAAAAILGIPREAVLADDGGLPRWRTARAIEVRATADGQLATLAVAPGQWVEQGALLGTAVAPERVRFRVPLLSGDLARLRDGLAVRLVSGEGQPAAYAGGGEGTLRLSPTVEPGDRTVDGLVPIAAAIPWARPGLPGFAEVLLEGTAEPELAIPRRAVVSDNGVPILFRRDPANPDKAIRLEADLGPDDGRWVAVRSGLRVGDEVVIDGVYPLLLATSGSIPKGGHFHSDGTFHADDH